jgi:hypothetical protein
MTGIRQEYDRMTDRNMTDRGPEINIWLILKFCKEKNWFGHYPGRYNLSEHNKYTLNWVKLIINDVKVTLFTMAIIHWCAIMTVAEIKSHKWQYSTVSFYEMTRRPHLDELTKRSHMMRWQDRHLRRDYKTVISDEMTWRSHCYEMARQAHQMRWPDGHIAMRWQDGHIWWDVIEGDDSVKHGDDIFLTVAIFTILDSYFRKLSEVEITMNKSAV